MQVRGQSKALSLPEDSSLSFLLGRMAGYVQRLLARHPKLDFEILEAVHWLLGSDMVREELLPLASMLCAAERRPRRHGEIEEEILNCRDFAHLMSQALHRNNGEAQCVADLLMDLLRKRQDRLQFPGVSDIEKKLASLQQMFGLNELEGEICVFFLILAVYDEAESFFQYFLKCDSYAGRTYLAAILNTTASRLSQVVHGKLSRIGLLESERGRIRLEPDFVHFLQDSGDADIETTFFQKIEPETLPLHVHSVTRDVTEHALQLLSAGGKTGCSILLYGSPGVGKTTYAYGLGKELGLDVYVCKHAGKDRAWQRQAAVVASVNMASQNKHALMIIDDCDSLLGTRHLWSLFGTYNDKKWLHEVLETPARIIFIVNDVRFLEESIVRRFHFSMHFKQFRRAQRILLWKKLLKRHGVESAMSDAQVSALAAVYDVSPGVIDQSVKKAAELRSSSKSDLYQHVSIALQAHESLIHGGSVPARPQTLKKDFVLEGLNVIGTDVSALLDDLEAFSEHLRNSDPDDFPGVSLLFHGPSGTGKSFLARYIASRLDREILIKRGSDLLSPYVGETEQRIRCAYEEAEAKEAILVIDEADSLILNRDRAQHSWEQSFTNEFLNSMEEFRFIQVFTTNRLMDLDSASLRRFHYKLEFGYLDSSGVVALYKKILLPLVGTDLGKYLEEALKNLACLTPGDFKVVKTKFQFKARHAVSHEALIAALKEEAKVKEIHAGKKAVGF